MTKKQVRDNAYYEARLSRDHPAIHADLKAGKYPTVTEAAVAAGLKTPRTRLHELKKAWSKASTAERDDFLQWLAGAGVTLPPTVASAGTGIAPVTIDRRLTPAAARRIEVIMSTRGLKPGDVMAEMGYPRLNASVASAAALKPDVIAALESWLTTNASV